jgi:hypothetical protein
MARSNGESDMAFSREKEVRNPMRSARVDLDNSIADRSLYAGNLDRRPVDDPWNMLGNATLANRPRLYKTAHSASPQSS